MALAFSAQAGVLRLHAGNHHQIKKHQVANPVITQSQAMELQAQQFNQPQRVITSMPEGELATYNRAGMSIFTGYFGVQSSQFADKMNIVYGTDGKVYIQNPLWWNKSYNTWVCGDFDPETGIISVPVGQYLMYNEDADLGVQLLWGHSIIYQDKDGYYMYEYFIDDVDAIRYQIDGENLYLLGCEGDPNADFPDYYNATGLLGHFSDGSNMTCLEYVGPGVPNGTLLNLRPAVPANPTNVTWQDRRWHSPAA